MGKLRNIALKTFRRYLQHCGLKHIRTKGGHEIWSAKHLTRPVVLQTHVDPIPEFIIKNTLRTIGKTEEQLLKFLEE
ncbi:MAG: type II toxin-antitoxin system HicA family toxin [Bacteroidetes bacterium]|nr:type II toxin-antitoxin system HicA family toxin [Bacteroidota bacterium]MBS1633507.1 type II toxin-antitoxin system HicA family toxin [Bacteroidota bacterium]